ncbi:MAG TPA: transglutaminase family protein [Abditibacteriaceae bacterium]|nr:transglutaminase family protein [Abditibacteriaceae bacterium]
MSETLTRRTIRVAYSSPVAHCVRQLRVVPTVQRGAQNVLSLDWKCWPQADEAREWNDDLGNRVLELKHHRIAREFHFEMTLRTKRDDMSTARDENLPPTGLGAFLLPSALCDSGAPIRDALRKTKADGLLRESEQTTEQLCHQLCRWTHQSIEYSVGATGLETTASQSLQRGKGVCQDYAHIMIALCRACGIPSRYVSGYNPAEGAMHAWVETLCGERGSERWLAWDPTHNRATRVDCVFVACGRDFRDVSPIRGSFQGRARARMQTWCATTCANELEA